jgi:hypothetical protein
MDSVSLDLVSQFNNIGLLVFAYIVNDVHSSSAEQCEGARAEGLVNWVLYGSAVVYGVMVGLYGLWVAGLLDHLLAMCCHAVCVTLNAISFLVLAIAFHLLTILYAVH